MAPPLFVLTSGHSGSKSMAQMLSQHPQIDCVHERMNQKPHGGLIIPISANVAHHVTPKHEKFPAYVVKTVNDERREGVVWAESNWRTYNLVPKILKAWPLAKFVHVVRDGRGSVAARYIHGQYYNPSSPHAHHIHQLHPLNGVVTGEVSQAHWDIMDTFEKLCWMWGHIQRTILSELEGTTHVRMPIERSNDQGYWGQIHLLADVEMRPVEMIHTHQKNNRPEHQPSAWNNKQKSAFERWCGSVMDELYPGWRNE